METKIHFYQRSTNLSRLHDIMIHFYFHSYSYYYLHVPKEIM